jgi:PAS domain S-box-containing protein
VSVVSHTLPTSRLVRVAAIALWLYAAGLFTCFVAPGLSLTVVTFLIDWASVPADVIVLAVTVLLLRSSLVKGYRRAAWHLLFASVAVDLGVGLLYPHLNVTVSPLYQAIMDAAYQVYYPLMTAACACFYLSCGGSFRRRHVWIDGATVLLGVVAILWAFLYESPPVLDSALAVTFGAKLVYTAGISATMTATLLLYSQISHGRSDQAALIIVGGSVVSLMTDVLWLGWSTGGAPVLGSIHDAGDLVFTAGDVMFDACIASAAAIEGRPRPVRESPGDLGEPTYSFLPALVLLLAIVLLAASEALQHGVDMRVLVGMVMLGAILFVARQRVVNAELHRLNRALALRESDARLTELVRRSADVIAVVNGAGIITFASAAADRMLGVPSASLQGSAAVELLGAGNVADLSKFLADLAANPPAGAELELEFATPAGEQRTVRVAGSDQRASPLIEGITLTLSDITEQRTLEREVLDIAARERLRLCSDIHDGLGQDLTGIALLLQSASASPAGNPQALQASLHSVAGHVNRVIATARELASGLSPLHVEGSLVQALRRLADSMNSRFPVEVRIEVSGEEVVLSESIADHLYRIAQESLNNALRHGGGRKIVVSLRVTADHAVLRVADDGRGFNAPAARRQGLGLRMIEYRARLMRGTLIIEQSPGGGTSLIVRVPCANGVN